MNIQSEIGLCVRVLFKKEWGKTLIGNKIRSQVWWQRRLQELLSDQSVIEIEVNTNPGIYNQDGTLQENPIPFETEIGLDENLSEYWLPWLQQIFMKRYERETTP